MHYPDSARQALLDLLDDPSSTDDQVRAELKRLANCSDVLPASACDELDVEHGSSYADAAESWGVGN